MEADLDTAVTWGTAGDYTVTLRSTNEDGVSNPCRSNCAHRQVASASNYRR
nr:hypothetical protein [Listeria monocytogenes]